MSPSLLSCQTSEYGCGGNGVCSPDGSSCECAAGWSNNTDWVSYPNCATSEVGMLVLWAVNFALCCFVFFRSLNVIIIRFETYFQQRKVKKDYTLWNNKGLIAVISYFCVSLPSHMAMAICHFVDPTTRVGFDAAPTLFFALGKMGFYGAVLFYQGPMLSVMLGRDPQMRHIVVLSGVGSAIIQFLVTTIGFLGFVTLANFPPLAQYVPSQITVMRVYYFVQGGALFANAALAFYVKFAVGRVLLFSSTLTAAGQQATAAGTSSSSANPAAAAANNKALDVMKRVNDLQGTVVRQGTIQGVVYLLFACIPFLFDKHAYFLPISWIIMPILGRKLAFQITLDKTQNRTLAQRLGLKPRGTGTASQNTSGTGALAAAPGGGGGKGSSVTNHNAATAGGGGGGAGGGEPATSFNVEATQVHTFVDADAEGKR